jgi:sigma-B regulation protein RsbU (phosphoserine phosphatase)
MDDKKLYGIKIATLAQTLISKLPNESPLTNSFIHELLQYQARIKDGHVNHRLLKELIHKYTLTQKQLIDLNKQLTDRQAALDKDLAAAAGIQRALLPHKAPENEALDFGWKFVPTDQVGGDIFNIFPLDEKQVGVYIIDVSGHGVPAAMMTLSVSQILSPLHGEFTKTKIDRSPYYRIKSPTEVMEQLDLEYPIERFGMYFTIFYMILNIEDATVCYSNAAHPPPLLLRKKGGVELLEEGGTIIGFGGRIPFEEEKKLLEKGDKMILYTDGITEYEADSTVYRVECPAPLVFSVFTS